MRRWAVLAAAAAVGLCGASEPPKQQNEPTGAEKENAADSRGSSGTPLYVKVVSAPKTATEANTEKRENDRKADIENKALLTNIILAALGIAQFVVTLITLRGLRHARVAAEAADKAADAAKKTVDAMVAAERAYVFFLDTVRVGESQVTAYHVKWRNFGKTPAMITGIRMGLAATDDPPPASEMPRYEMPFGAIIGAGDGWRRGGVSMQDVREELEAHTPVYLIGEITYRDIQGGSHRTWFCRLYTGAQFVLDADIDESLNGYD